MGKRTVCSMLSELSQVVFDLVKQLCGQVLQACSFLLLLHPCSTLGGARAAARGHMMLLMMIDMMMIGFMRRLQVVIRQ